MPPMILLKGKRMKPELADDIPPGSVCRMTEKGSMTTKCFVDWLHHFGSYKSPGRCVLMFEGAKSHLDYDIVEAADQYDIVLYCIPSNTTHELQPLDKPVFRSFEYHWDQQVMLYWHNHGYRTLTH
ncbi:DDE superfamily endonuclease [Popillia japonica]|uniref:DDE superfamily endonuclease n=1 Tax=Popillia japonica TaxID=7064 RepID=A0AAW1M1G1_POPJA